MTTATSLDEVTNQSRIDLGGTTYNEEVYHEQT